jgi:hypothetical protein
LLFHNKPILFFRYVVASLSDNPREPTMHGCNLCGMSSADPTATLTHVGTFHPQVFGSVEDFVFFNGVDVDQLKRGPEVRLTRIDTDGKLP